MASDDRKGRQYLNDLSSSGYRDRIKPGTTRTKKDHAVKVAVAVVAVALVIAIYVLSYLRGTPPESTSPVALPEPVAAAPKIVAPAPNDQANLWEEPAWTACVDDYKNAYKSARARKTEEPPWFRFYDGQCAEELPNIPDRSYYLMVRGPSDLFNSNGFEITLNVNNERGNETVCSNRAGRYAEWFESQMKSDPRCRQFPELLAVRMDKTKYSAKKASKDVKALDGQSSCESTVVNGLPKKFVTYQERGKTYAINGTARDIASSRGWLDGKGHFTVEQMQKLLARGLAACD